MSERITVDFKDGVAHVRMTRVDKMNALDPAMFEALVSTGDKLCKQADLRAVVLSGDGKAFCAGLDFSNFNKMASGERRETSTLVESPRRASGANNAQHAVLVWREIPVPVIAAVHGVAFGGGFQLTLGADLRFVTPDARLSVMEINWGLIPDMGGMTLMRELVRGDIARDLTYSGRIFSGEEAAAIGIATRVCADPVEEALAYARDVAGKNPDAMRAAKRLLNAAFDADAAHILRQESEEQVALIGTPNQQEAVRARLEKRAPAFS